MKVHFIATVVYLSSATFAFAQSQKEDNEQEQSIRDLIAQYSQARETKDSVLLKAILTDDIDQLASNGEWRNGLVEALAGMQRSSTSRPGSRRLIVERIRFLNTECGIVDARYEIDNPDGSIRKMWSAFIVTHQDQRWKIAAIRNMLPTQ